MPDLETLAIEAGWGVVYALPWLGAFLVGRWAWGRLRPYSAFLAWAAATPIALASLLVLAMALTSVLDVLVPPVAAR